jgi:hypothetical protein
MANRVYLIEEVHDTKKWEESCGVPTERNYEYHNIINPIRRDRHKIEEDRNKLMRKYESEAADRKIEFSKLSESSFSFKDGMQSGLVNLYIREFDLE